LAFGTVKHGTVSTPQSIILTNTSPLANLTISSISKGGSNPNQFVIQSSTCSGTIAAHTTCQINVTFNPSSTGTKSATINVNVAAPGTNGSVPVSGTGN